MQSIFGNEIPFDKTKYFTEFNHPGVLLENKEKSATIFKAIHQLPEAQKTVFTLHKVDGKSYKEISEIMEKWERNNQNDEKRFTQMRLRQFGFGHYGFTQNG
jgi:DNA-directed RNA polymerase specialized sigma24 family protein